MRRLTGLVAVLAFAVALYGGYWLWQSRALASATADWFDDRRAEGWVASYTDIAVRGFPSRLDLTVEGVVLGDPETGMLWETPFVQALRLAYNPDHLILAFADTQTLTVDGARHVITSDGLRASLVTEGERILRANLEAAVLNVEGPERSLALAGLTAALQNVPGVPRNYRIGVNAEAAALGGDGALPRPERVDGLQLQAEVVFDGDWTRQSLAGPRPQPERIDLKLAELRVEGLEVNLAGQLDVDAQGRGDGTVTLRAVNWRAALEAARAEGTLPDWLGAALIDALAIAAQLSGRADTLDATITLDEGRMALGLIPLGPAPRLRLP